VVQSPAGHEYDNSNQLIYDGGAPELNGDDNPATSANEVWFDDNVFFNCDDLGQEIMVTMRVFEVDPGPGPVNPYRMYNPNGDLYGHFSDCWSVVEVECKLPPIVTAPDLYLTCEANTDPYANPELYPEILSICGYTAEFEDSDHLGDVCSGYIQRTWTVESCGKTVTKVQNIYLNATEAFDPCTITFPADITQEDCPGSEMDPGFPTWDEHPCNIVTAEIVNVDTFNFVEGACYKIVIDWAVIDWCVYEANSGAENNADLVNGRKLLCNDLVEDGYYRYTQVLKVTDLIAPEITVEDQCIGVTTACYAEGVELTAFATDSCNVDQKFWWKYIVTNLDSWETVQYSYNYTPEPTEGKKGSRSKDDLDNTVEAKLQILDPLAIGNYRVEWTVGDGCGNASSTYQYFSVADKKAPTPFLVDISTALMSNGMVEMTAIFFDKGACNGNCLASFDECSDVLYFTFTDVLPVIEHPEWIDPNGLYYFDPLTGTQFNATSGLARYLDGTAHSWDPVALTSGKVFFCEDRPSVEVDVYVWDKFALNGDCDDGNYDYATAILQLIDDTGDCEDNGLYATLSGNTLYRDTELKVDNVEVELDRDNPEYPVTEVSTGSYSFEEVGHGNYEMRANKYDEPMNGVSTIDLLLIQKHLLGIKAFDDVYDYIAADANRSGSISVGDLFELRNLILAVNSELPGGKSWRFVDADYEFNNPLDPFLEMEDAEVRDLTVIGDRDELDFRGVKLGDLNGTVQLFLENQVEPRSDQKLQLYIDLDEVEAESVVEVPVYASEVKALYGMQFTLQTGVLDIVEVVAGKVDLSSVNYAVHQNNVLTFSWNNVEGIDIAADEVLMTLKLRSHNDCLLSDNLSIGSSLTRAEAYVTDALTIRDVDLRVGEQEEFVFDLLQNVPNPFTESTEIQFILDKDSDYELIIHDLTGKTLKVITGEGKKGLNSEILEKGNLPAGILYYKLNSDTNTKTRKMLLIK
jgi:hypothetical protein